MREIEMKKRKKKMVMPLPTELHIERDTSILIKFLHDQYSSIDMVDE